MLKSPFHRHQIIHDFRNYIATILTLAAPFILLFLTWLLAKEVVSWMWTVLTPPLAWGDWPVQR